MNLKELEFLDNNTKTKLIENLLDTLSKLLNFSKEKLLEAILKDLKKV